MHYRARRITESEDPKVTTFNVGYDDAWQGRDDSLAKELGLILRHFYRTGYHLARRHFWDRAA